MQLEKSFCYRYYIRAFILVIFVAFNLQKAHAQAKVIEHKLVKKETLYKLSILYRTEVDSIMRWNNLSSTLVSQGAVIRILDYNKLKLEEFVYNQYVYDIEVKKAEKVLLLESFNAKNLALQTRKKAIDEKDPQAMQEFFEIAKIKKNYSDSITLINDKMDQEIRDLYSEKAEVEEDIKRKYPKQYNEQGYTTILKEKEKRSSSINELPQTEIKELIAVSKQTQFKDEEAIKREEEISKATEQKVILEQKQWEKEEKVRQALLAKELKEQEKQAKKEEKAKAKELAVSKKLKGTNVVLDISPKEEAAIAGKKEQIKAVQINEENEALDLAKQKKDAEKIAKEAELVKQKEVEKIAKEKLEAQKKAQAEMSEEDLKMLQLQKELAAMEAAKAKKLKEMEQKEVITEITKPMELKPKVEEVPKELSSQEALKIQKEEEIAAMAEAKKRAKEEQIAAKSAMEAASAKKQKELEQKDVQVTEKEEIIKPVVQDSKIEELPKESSTKEILISEKEKELVAMAEAKQRAKDELLAAKAVKEESKEQEKLFQDSIANVKRNEQIDENQNKDPDVLIFDVGFENNQDILSKKYQKQQAKLSKEFEAEVDSSKVTRSITVDEVVIKKSKKTGNFKMGDKVDAVTIDKSRFYLSRSMMEIDKGNYKKAIEYADKSIDLNPNYTEAYMLKGDMLASFGYFDKAYNQYEKANTVDSRIPQLHYNMGNCLIYMGKKDKALEQMGEAIAIDPNYILAYAGRSSLLMEMKQYKSALHDYNTILQINKYFYPAFKGRGLAFLNLGKYQDAIRDFNQLLEYDKGDPSIYYHRGMAKMYVSEIYGACMDFLSASERGYAEANKAINKYCD